MLCSDAWLVVPKLWQQKCVELSNKNLFLGLNPAFNVWEKHTHTHTHTHLYSYLCGAFTLTSIHLYILTQTLTLTLT